MTVGLRILLTLASFTIVSAGIHSAKEILTPLLLAAFLATICAPTLGWLIRRLGSRPLALLIVILGMAVVCAAVAAMIGRPIHDLHQNLDDYKQPLQQKVNALAAQLTSMGIDIPDDIQDTSLNTDEAVEHLRKLLGGLIGLFGKGMFVLFYFVFILLEASGFPDKLAAMPGDTAERKKRLNKVLVETRQYVAIKTVTSLATGVAIGLSLLLLEIPHAPLWGLLAFLFNYIPNIGSIIAAAPPIVLAFITGDGSTVIWVMIVFVSVNLIVGNFIEPRMMGQGLGLSTLVILLSLVFWGFVLGPVGMLLSVPLTMVAKIALSASDDTHWLAILLSDKAPPAETTGAVTG